MVNFFFYCIALFGIFFNLCATDVWVIDSQKDWQEQVKNKENLEFKNGFADPTAKHAVFTSKMKVFKKKVLVDEIILEQSPVWQNWKPISNVGPSNLQNAPVALSVGPGNYWLFGRYGGHKRMKGFNAEVAKLAGYDIPLMTTPFPNQFNAPGGLEPSKGGYHAWQSRDMVNWVHHGPVTENFSRWVTTAEYVDGKFYIYYDYPNDQDPHLYVDDNLFDGKPGKNMGLAFKDPSDGSDCAFIRDEEGKFHVIYEDWSPIKASARSWDSPIAGHAVSNDGLGDFTILSPVIDKRTNPTGKFAEYNHLHWTEHPDFKSNIARYEIHTPAQEAFGDWASIKVGDQFYLFGDYDPVGTHKMSTCWFTSDSLYKEFTWCDHIGEGHPDPDIFFANDKFYLITQQKTDFASPGPWVETVKVRVGVDIDSDNKIDKWTDWQEVKETYDYKSGFVKHITKTSAKLDLSSLPAGYGFQFEIEMIDTTTNKSKPIIDNVTLNFK